MDQLTACRILGIPPSCSREEIRDAFRKKSQDVHPEENPEEFARIQAAYRTLTQRQTFPAPQAFTFEQPHPVVNEEELSFFRSLEQENAEERMEERERKKQLEDLRNIVIYGKMVTDPEYLMYLLERYPLSMAQYTRLKQRLSSGTEAVILRKSSCRKELMDFLRIGAGARMMSIRELLVFGAVLLSFILLGYASKTGAETFIAIFCAMTLVIYCAMRYNTTPMFSNAILCFFAMVIGMLLFISDVTYISIIGFLVFMAAPVGEVVIIIQAIILAFRKRKTKDPSSLDNP